MATEQLFNGTTDAATEYTKLNAQDLTFNAQYSILNTQYEY